MKDRPILFTPENAQKCHDGTKTQTRRTTGLQQFNEQPSRWRLEGNQFAFDGGFEYVPVPPCPYGQVGDRLYVKESHYAYGLWVRRQVTRRGKTRMAWRFKRSHRYGFYLYQDAPPEQQCIGTFRDAKRAQWWKRSALFMPKDAARLWLEITEIRVQRLQEISEEDCLAEGVEYFYAGLFRDYLQSGDVGIESAVGSYRSLWESINGPGSWDANPWVWAITFKKVDR